MLLSYSVVGCFAPNKFSNSKLCLWWQLGERNPFYFEALKANSHLLMFLLFHQCFSSVSPVLQQCFTSISVHIGFILDAYWIDIGYTLDTHWIHIGYTLDIQWIHIGYTLHIFCTLDSLWIHIEYRLDTHWIYIGYTLATHRPQNFFLSQIFFDPTILLT